MDKYCFIYFIGEEKVCEIGITDNYDELLKQRRKQYYLLREETVDTINIHI